MIWLLAGLAAAMPLRLTPSPGATIDVLPPVVAGRVDIMIHDNVVDLRPQMGDTPLEGIRSWRLLDMGSAWLLSLNMRERGSSMSLEHVGDTWTGTPVPLPALPASGGVCDATPRSPLTPLRGIDTLGRLNADLVAPVMPRWPEAEPGPPAWETIAALRRTLDRADAKQHYALGALHRDLGHAREAEYYFSAAARLGAPGPVAVLQRAGAQLAARDWGGALQSAVEARALGADEEVLTQVEGIVALMTGQPDGVLAGRALALSSGKASSSLIAGELLLRGGCAVEAASVLQRAVHDANEGVANLALRRLVDARVLRGDIRSAEGALKELSARTTSRASEPSIRSAARMLKLLEQSPDAWAQMTPTLDRLGRGSDDEAFEALFLLGQISETLGDTRTATHAWVSLVDRDRSLLVGEPGRRLLGSWQRRVRTLLAGGRDLDALAVHNGVWRPGLTALMTDPSPLYDLAAAAERLEMFAPALDLMRIASEVEGRYALDDRTSILTIARLYRRSGRTAEASEALDLLATRPPDPWAAGRVALLRAQVREDAGDPDAAAAFYASIVPPLPEAPEALLRRAMLDAHHGRCAEALAVFAAPPSPFPPTVSQAEVDQDQARCLFALGQPESARLAAARAASELADPRAVGFVSYTSGAASTVAGFWSRLQGEDEEQAALDARVTASRGAPSSPGAGDR